MLISLILGIACGWGFAAWAYMQPLHTATRWLACGLVIAGLVYVVFWFHGAPMHWLWIESAGLVGCLGFAALGLWRSPWFLAVGWALHGLWDVFLHDPTTTAFVPVWYPMACLGFDLTVAALIAFRLLKAKPTT